MFHSVRLQCWTRINRSDFTGFSTTPRKTHITFTEMLRRCGTLCNVFMCRTLLTKILLSVNNVYTDKRRSPVFSTTAHVLQTSRLSMTIEDGGARRGGNHTRCDRVVVKPCRASFVYPDRWPKHTLVTCRRRRILKTKTDSSTQQW